MGRKIKSKIVEEKIIYESDCGKIIQYTEIIGNEELNYCIIYEKEFHEEFENGYRWSQRDLIY